MRRVGLEVDEDRLAVGQLVGALGAVVVLDVAGAALRDRGDGLERRGALELGEDRLVGAAEVVGEHVEPAAVGHADDDLARAVRGGELDQLVDHRHGHVEALDRELLLAQVGLVHEALERVDLDQALEQRLLLVGGQRLAELAGLDLLAQPHALAVAADVLDLVGDRAAVGLAQVRQRVGQRRARARTCAGSWPGSGPSARASGRAARGRAPGRPRARRAERVELARRGGRGCGGPSAARSRPGRPAAAPRRPRPRRAGRARGLAHGGGRGGGGRRRGRGPSSTPSELKTPS